MRKHIQIDSEQDAWNAIFTISESMDDNEIHFDIDLGEWAKFELKLKGPQYEGTISSDTVDFVKSYQNAFYKSFALAKYGVSNVNHLQKSEKEALKVFFKVEKGSTQFIAQLLETFNNLKDYFEDMTPDQKYKLALIAMILMAALYGGTTGFSTYIENKRIERLDNTSHTETMQMLEALSFANEKQNENMSKVIELSKENLNLAKIIAEHDALNRSLLDIAKKADSAEILGNEIERPVAKELTKTNREKPQETRMDGIYRVTKISDPEQGSSEFQIKVLKVDTNDYLNATLDTRLVSIENKENIFISLKDGKNISLTINVRISRGNILSADILGAEFPENIETGAGE